jgi:DNA-binding response OmpR family regulator
MKILVIDDDDLVRRTVAKILRSDGHEVVCAGDGIAGMRVFREQAPELVVTDIIMPEREGIETILAIRRENPKVKIIAISGGGQFGEVEVLKMAQLLGADDVIAKPFRAEELLSRISTREPAPAAAQ